jgi:hypothetical protein
MTRKHIRKLAGLPRRSGAATLDYVLTLGAILPLAGLSFYYCSRIMKAAYEMMCVLIAWPFM